MAPVSGGDRSSAAAFEVRGKRTVQVYEDCLKGQSTRISVLRLRFQLALAAVNDLLFYLEKDREYEDCD